MSNEVVENTKAFVKGYKLNGYDLLSISYVVRNSDRNLSSHLDIDKLEEDVFDCFVLYHYKDKAENRYYFKLFFISHCHTESENCGCIDEGLNYSIALEEEGENYKFVLKRDDCVVYQTALFSDSSVGVKLLLYTLRLFQKAIDLYDFEEQGDFFKLAERKPSIAYIQGLLDKLDSSIE